MCGSGLKRAKGEGGRRKHPSQNSNTTRASLYSSLQGRSKRGEYSEQYRIQSKGQEHRGGALNETGGFHHGRERRNRENGLHAGVGGMVREEPDSVHTSGPGYGEQGARQFEALLQWRGS